MILAGDPCCRFRFTILITVPHLAEISSNDQTLEAAERTHILAILKETRWVLGGSRGAARASE